MKKRRRYKWIAVIAVVAALVVAIQVARHYFSAEEREARTRLRKALLDEYPEAVRELKAHYGIKPFTPKAEQMADRLSRSTVVLVHGLDDPGKVWMNLAPALESEGHAVWILTYPNDQPLVESSRFFKAQLQNGALSKKKGITIVAHSMGGLVTRDMLTDPALGYAEQVENGMLPPVERLIMVATPNHGSELARFRGFIEFRDQLSSFLKDDYHWLQGIVDGAGEAGIDLLPDSDFLEVLNSRPHPAGVRMQVIAGVMSPRDREEIMAMARRLEEKLPDAAREAVRELSENLIALLEQVGDGLVSVASARLQGVPLQTVAGTHLSIIRNLSVDSRRVPPAVPLITKQLRESTPAEKKAVRVPGFQDSGVRGAEVEGGIQQMD